MKPSSIVLILACLSAVPAVAQQVYSWTDTNGTKHFSDTPPPPNTASAKKLIVHSGVTSTAVEAEAEQPKAGPSMAAAAGYSEDDIKRNCAAARRNLEIYNASAPGDDALPETQVQYQMNLNKAKEQIKLFCG
ncbi:MAG: DUF4124 domain-containing protein [Xanthomonadales bacterium]|nr:DUF4124 domain-containing protein [Xanthomonadales bacterium]HQX65851.1 DUF4124 domain-containing protein [Dokdonella sp.]MBK7012398.1 DUF4124 domain-containing protein [Xanthomonadales bacterium]MBK7210809.1 DUF4124 domain-containing protein [Xanthomonadales bacterium]MBL0222989.1 DUF4124 domain-containing protein [Xanthomonadales bacterium]